MKLFFKKNNSWRKSPDCTTGGFTLVETLVAISIFTMSILASMVILAGGISNTTSAKQKIIGAYLGQEGIEYIHNLRDTYMLFDPLGGQSGWTAFKNKLASGGCNQSNGCYFDDQNLDYSNQSQPITGITIVGCGSSCTPLLYNSSTGRYNYVVGGTASGFTRKIETATIGNDELKVTSTVSWRQGSNTASVTFSENLFDWSE